MVCVVGGAGCVVWWGGRVWWGVGGGGERLTLAKVPMSN